MLKTVNLKQFIYWFVAYIPVISLLILKYFQATYFTKGLKVQIVFCKINIWGDFFIYLLVCIVTIVCYYLSAKKFEHSKMKEIKKNNGQKKIQVRAYEPISINEYSFFILSLLLPFVTEDPSNLLNLLIMLTLIFIIIVIMIKKNQIIINPIFLFSRFKVYKITGERAGIRQEYFVISKCQDFVSDSDEGYNFVKFDETFNEVIFIAEED